ncbi:MAG: cytochrome d ubiquinol oxidase subunit II [Deltaproteobacteria bacterium]|nr:cytochrome d ubiquinol oxidase subunit II [Deltaproteobacteria bacterium]
MGTLWYGIVASMIGVYVVLDGFDLGAGVLHRFIAQTESERRQVLAAFGPYWDGNEVWLLAAGGTLFFAFPRAYAVGFSGFYLPLMLVLWLLVLRGVSIEFRSHHESALWTLFWDSTLSLSSGLLAVVFGAALGNIIRGVPIDASGYFSMGFFELHGPGVLDGYTVLVGAFTLVLLTTHGALFLSWKTEGPVQTRARKVARVAGGLALALLVVATVASHLVQPALFAVMGSRPLACVLAGVAALGIAAAVVGIVRGRDLLAFLGSSATIVGILAATAALRYPILLPSTIDPSQSIAVHNAAAGEAGLAAGLWWWPIGLVLACAYFTFLFHRFRGKARGGH